MTSTNLCDARLETPTEFNGLAPTRTSTVSDGSPPSALPPLSAESEARNEFNPYDSPAVAAPVIDAERPASIACVKLAPWAIAISRTMAMAQIGRAHV